MTNHGGKRTGSGRKNEGKVQVCYKLAPDVVKFLREHISYKYVIVNKKHSKRLIKYLKKY